MLTAIKDTNTPTPCSTADPAEAVAKPSQIRRARRIVDLPLDFIPNERFALVRSENKDKAILGPMPASETEGKNPRPPSGLPPYLASLYEVPLLTPEQEGHLFRKMNYLKYKASKLRDELDLTRPKAGLMDQIERCCKDAGATKNQIICANLRLVVSIAKRHVSPSENFFDLVSDGNMSLIQAVEKFDFARGKKFSTYATKAIMNGFARTIPREHCHRDRFRTGPAEEITEAADDGSDELGQEMAQVRREAKVESIIGSLNELEQKIIVRRFGLHRCQEPRKLEQIGTELGFSKERVRQLEARALVKLHDAAVEAKIEVPG